MHQEQAAPREDLILDLWNGEESLVGVGLQSAFSAPVGPTLVTMTAKDVAYELGASGLEVAIDGAREALPIGTTTDE